MTTAQPPAHGQGFWLTRAAYDSLALGVAASTVVGHALLALEAQHSGTGVDEALHDVALRAFSCKQTAIAGNKDRLLVNYLGNIQLPSPPWLAMLVRSNSPSRQPTSWCHQFAR